MDSPNWRHGRVGYVTLVGRPNTGKSTFLNSILDFHLAPVCAKPQTTQRKLLGIYSDSEAQFLFLDTPGVHQGKEVLDSAMLTAVRKAVADADVVLCFVDPTRPGGEEDRLAADIVAAARCPTLLLLNKADLASPADRAAARNRWQEFLPGTVPVFEICALRRTTLVPVIQAIRNALPEGPFQYDPDSITDTLERHIGRELIREALLETLRDEVPYATAVDIEYWHEYPDHRQISVVLSVERQSQKGILVGTAGRTLKELRSRAQTKLAELCGVEVKLRFFVKVTPNWRSDTGFLRHLGYL
jgi:GTP-binding protein Era